MPELTVQPPSPPPVTSLQQRFASVDDLLAGLAREEFDRRMQTVAKLLPRAKAEYYKAVILDHIGIRQFRIGMVEPDSIDTTDSLARALQTTTQAINFERIDQQAFAALFSIAYNPEITDPQQAERLAARMTSLWSEMDTTPIVSPILADEDQYVELYEADSRWRWKEREIPPTTRDFAMRVLLEAFIAGASDIHVEASRGVGRIRFRCDSLMYLRWVDIPEERAKQLVNALAAMAGAKQELLKFHRHDSTIKVKVHRRNGGAIETEYRVSFAPALPWPEVVLRINSDVIDVIENIGFLPRQLEEIQRGLLFPQGLVLVTGPTGSGKSNTLQAIFSHFERDDALKIIEFGDPIEFLSPRRTQLRMTDEFDWEEALKTSMRQDPDVISPAECRDFSAASALINAALTGHVCFTTLHTNDIAATFTRLSKLEIAPNLQSDAINLIINQRLIRLLCVECRKLDEGPTQIFKAPIYKATGCAHCYGKGYKGRTAIAEVLLVRPEIRDWIAQGVEGRLIVERAIERDWMVRIQDAANQKLRAGLTSLLEIERVMNRDDDLRAHGPRVAALDAHAASEHPSIPPRQLVMDPGRNGGNPADHGPQHDMLALMYQFMQQQAAAAEQERAARALIYQQVLSSMHQQAAAAERDREERAAQRAENEQLRQNNAMLNNTTTALANEVLRRLAQEPRAA